MKNNAARLHPPASADAASPSQVDDAPSAANDVDAAEPRYVVTADTRADFVEQATALSDDEIVTFPARPEEQLEWMDGLQATAWRDRGALVTIDLDGDRITPDEIHQFGMCIEWAREVIAAARLSASTASPEGVVLSVRTQARTISADQRVLHNALKMRFRKSVEPRRELARVRRPRSERSVSARTTALLVLCADPTIEAWLRTLPRGEGQALDRLRSQHAEWVSQRKQSRPGVERKRAQRDLAARAFTLLAQRRERLLAAGRYLLADRADRRGDYPGFRVAKARKRTKA